MNKSYTATPYFFGKSFADLPFQIILMTISALMVYFALGFNLETADNFFTFWLIINLNYFASSSYGFCASILIPNYELALAIIPITGNLLF